MKKNQIRIYKKVNKEIRNQFNNTQKGENEMEEEMKVEAMEGEIVEEEKKGALDKVREMSLLKKGTIVAAFATAGYTIYRIIKVLRENRDDVIDAEYTEDVTINPEA